MEEECLHLVLEIMGLVMDVKTGIRTRMSRETESFIEWQGLFLMGCIVFIVIYLSIIT